MNTTSDPRPVPVDPDQEPAETPTARPSRALPYDRQLPGLGWRDSGYRHFVPAGTLPVPGEPENYRAPGCGAVCLLMPPHRKNHEYEWERLPLHPDCQPPPTAGTGQPDTPAPTDD